MCCPLRMRRCRESFAFAWHGLPDSNELAIRRAGADDQSVATQNETPLGGSWGTMPVHTRPRVHRFKGRARLDQGLAVKRRPHPAIPAAQLAASPPQTWPGLAAAGAQPNLRHLRYAA